MAGLVLTIEDGLRYLNRENLKNDSVKDAKSNCTFSVVMYWEIIVNPDVKLS